jgi:ATP-dependent Zn protease
MASETHSLHGSASTAYHEAGHAVAAVAHKGKLKTVTIVPGKGYAGRVRRHRERNLQGIERDNTPRGQRAAENAAQIELAGYIAQKRYKRRSCHKYHWESDRNAATDLLLSFSSSTRHLDAYIKAISIRTEDLVAHWWPAIKAVAAALLERGTLSGDEVQKIVEAAMRRATPSDCSRNDT